MSQHQSRRDEDEAIRYGEVFNVYGELARKPITPETQPRCNPGRPNSLRNPKGWPCCHDGICGCKTLKSQCC
ncbi:Seed maturation protein [Arachis hypogaea]|nr:Seed maturation protein [Arachis hypogaea]